MVLEIVKKNMLEMHLLNQWKNVRVMDGKMI